VHVIFFSATIFQNLFSSNKYFTELQTGYAADAGINVCRSSFNICYFHLILIKTGMY